MAAKIKIIADVPADVKEKLKDLAHEGRTNMTEIVIKLIEQAHKSTLKTK